MVRERKGRGMINQDASQSYGESRPKVWPLQVPPEAGQTLPESPTGRTASVSHNSGVGGRGRMCSQPEANKPLKPKSVKGKNKVGEIHLLLTKSRYYPPPPRFSPS